MNASTKKPKKKNPENRNADRQLGSLNQCNENTDDPT